MQDASDEDLMRILIAEQSHEAFSLLVTRHALRFRQIAYRQIGLREEAEDIVQNAFLKIWDRPALWKEDQQTKFTTWFHRVVINQCLDYQKRKKPRGIIEGEDFIDDTPSQEEALSQKQKEKKIESAFRQLSPSMQTALNLGFYDKVSNREAAEIMGLNLKAYQSLLIRAKLLLKDYVLRDVAFKSPPIQQNTLEKRREAR